ncbi:MAG: hypothetical protein JWO36_6851 [Myxococcales bacterium]|nr:hypothetical protein [Myxococcales bacterium]
MQLRRVILYQNGIGYFERSGHVGGDTLKLELARGELDDVLKTLTVIDRLGAGVATVDVPTLGEQDRTIALGVRMSAGRVHDVQVSYAVPTPTWKAAYRVVVDDSKSGGLLQAWAMVNNTSQEDWNNVSLTLATGAPMSFAMDLHTPEYVKRPDATGRLVAPTVIGLVDDEKVGASDRDHDGIADVDDKCPNEPETFNGSEDEDGCPDRGRVAVTSTNIEILDRIYFTKNGDVLMPQSAPIVDAIAATLRGNPDILEVELDGHASSDEADAWGLASWRAASVRGALVARGVAASRLAIAPFGATQPVDRSDTEEARHKNRRVEFVIRERREHRADHGHMGMRLDAKAVQASAHTKSSSSDVAGSVRYVLGEPVSIHRGASSMVSILNKPVSAEDAFLFRPDGNAPGSDRHPFRAVRVANTSGFTLEPGPIAIFARGTFVGDSLMHRLDLGETAWVPYALDGGTTVTVTTDDAERAVRIKSIQRGVLTVENVGVRTTRYAIAAGREPARQIYLRYAKLAGYEIKDLPPGTLDQGDAYLIPLPLQAGRSSVLAIEAREPRQRTLQLLDEGATALGLYVEGSKLPPGVAEKLAAAVTMRKELGVLEEETVELRRRVGDLAAHAQDIRENLRAIDKVAGTVDLRKKLVANLTQATADTDALARSLGAKLEALATTRSRLQDSLREITLE